MFLNTSTAGLLLLARVERLGPGSMGIGLIGQLNKVNTQAAFLDSTRFSLARHNFSEHTFALSSIFYRRSLYVSLLSQQEHNPFV